jgi:cyclomaltodextrinase
MHDPRQGVGVAHWAEHAIFWHVYPLGFVGAPRDAAPPNPEPQAIPRLRQLAGWFDYLIELGANGLLLGPVFASETHGYDTVDHFRVDPRLGTEDDLRWLIAEAHDRGIRVVLDGVFNHVGRSFERLSDVELRRDAGGELATFEGHHRLAVLNHDSALVVDYVTDVMTHWLDRGIDGWRLDAAYAVPTEFWRQVSDRVHAAHPDAWLLGEVIHGDYTRFVTEGGLDSVTQYELWKATWSALVDGNFYELAHALERHQELLEVFVPQTFLGNHDVTRIASQLTDPRHLPHAVAMLVTVAGIPSIYAGDEQGFTGVKEHREGGDDAVRPPFPTGPAELSGIGAPVHQLYRELIALRRRHPWLVRAETRVEHLDNRQLVYRSTADGAAVLVALNLDDAQFPVDLPAGEWRLEAGQAAVGGSKLMVTGHGWAVLADSAGRA